MVKLSKNTQRAIGWLNSEIQGYKLADVYGSYSSHKERAFRECIEICKEKEGWGLCIISHNHNYFTVKFTTDAGVFIVTYANIYFIEN